MPTASTQFRFKMAKIRPQRPNYQPTGRELAAANMRHNQGLVEPNDSHVVRRVQRSKEKSTDTTASSIAAIFLATLPVLMNWTSVVALIFGGCCSNVFALEAIIKEEPQSGLLITFVQFFVAALITWPSQFSTKHPPFFFKPRAVPLLRWLPNTAMFFVVNLMNNWAFAFNISVPVHIIIRSGGTAMTMAVGRVWGKKYTRMQVWSVAMITVGIIIAAMADAQSTGKTKSPTSPTIFDTEFLSGLTILFLAQLISAVMGLYVQITYDQYGNQHWHENLFYSHFLAIPFFLPFSSSLLEQFRQLASSPPIKLSPFIFSLFLAPAAAAQTDSKLPPIMLSSTSPTFAIPKHILTLALNAVTQYACISGVNILAAQSTALGVSIALNVRKLASLFLSIYLFGNRLPAGVIVGAAIVFGSASIWAWEGQRIRKEERDKTSEKKQQ